MSATIVTSVTTSQVVLAETPQEKGLQIAVAADQHAAGWNDSQSDMKMVLRNAQGKESIRYLKVKALEIPDDGDKSLTIFNQPRDVKGTALLTFSHKEGDDDQWLYLPAVKRVKRIASRNKTGPFMGSEFAYEDMSSQEVDKYDYKYLRDEPCGEWTCYVMERFPKDKNSGYTRQTVWMDQAEYRLVKTEFYDRKKSLLKTLIIKGHQQYKDKFWRPAEMQMQNHQTGKSTVLEISNIKFDNGLSKKDFNKNSLKRIK
ncbi:outer membrane lipoprotein-sorting protein [Pelagibaculum spongiae]|uniref:Outer membrane lipoprotein-sorting protein n=2 Tax=Pelagibaculum spongiae TaxID=2080658 RepID=A0A2V1GWU4_9GAMM|nr:outer membrane lipoprotein-sorting protein [Pelagibaculum spongiae]